MKYLYPAGSLQVERNFTLLGHGPSIQSPAASDKAPMVIGWTSTARSLRQIFGSLESIANIDRKISAGAQSSRHNIESWRAESRDVPQEEDSITQEVESSA